MSSGRSSLEAAEDGGVEFISSPDGEESLESDPTDSEDDSVDTSPVKCLTEIVSTFDGPAASFANSTAAVRYSA